MTDAKKIYAGFWKRAVAAFIDGFILSLLYLPARILFTFFYAVGFSFIEIYLIGTTIVLMVYMCGSEGSSWQASPGKMILGIKVTDTAFQRISYIQAAIRRFWPPFFLIMFLANVQIKLFLFLFLLYFIDCVMAAFTPKKQAFHDMIGQTYVVNASYLNPLKRAQQEEFVKPTDGGFDQNALTPLMLAVYNEDKDGVEKVIKETPNEINKINPKTGASALWMAAAYGNIEIIKLLVANGADLKNTNREGVSIVEIARKMGHDDAAELIENHTPKF